MVKDRRQGTRVNDKGAAKLAGIEPGDMIIKFDDIMASGTPSGDPAKRVRVRRRSASSFGRDDEDGARTQPKSRYSILSAAACKLFIFLGILVSPLGLEPRTP